MLVNQKSLTEYLNTHIDCDGLVCSSIVKQDINKFSVRHLSKEFQVRELRFYKHASSGAKITRTIIFKDARYMICPEHEIRHLLGLARLRHALNKDTSFWQLNELSGADSPEPDAWFKKDGQEIPIEYDAGFYSRVRVAAKMESFSKYPFQIWATASERRSRNMQKVLVDAGYKGRIYWINL